VKFRIWLYQSSGGWCVANKSEQTITDSWTERLDVWGYNRIYVEVLETDGTVEPVFAICVPS